MEAVIGIDIGGTNSIVGLVTKSGRILSCLSVPTGRHQEVEHFIQDLNKGITKLAEEAGNGVNIRGIGIGAPNANYYKGTIENAPNLPWKGILPFKKIFKSYRNVPVTLTNDANAAAVGEMIYGGARKMKNFILLTLGTGLGSGIVVNGEVLYGHTGFAGEMGHIVMIPEGRVCGCGKKGCLETYVSATGICRTAMELLNEKKTNSLLDQHQLEKHSSRAVFEAAKKGDPVALESFEKTGKMLALAIVNALAFTSPEAIFLFGGLANAGDFLIEPTKKWLDEYVQVFFRNSFELLFSSLEKNNAAVLGASALAWKEMKK